MIHTHTKVTTTFHFKSGPRLPSAAAAVSAHPNGKPESFKLRLLTRNMCGVVGVELPSRKHGIRGTPGLPAIMMFSAGAT